MEKEIRFEVTQYIRKFVHVKEEYGYVEVENEYVVNNWDDLQSLLLTLIDFGKDETKFRVKKVEVTD